MWGVDTNTYKYKHSLESTPYTLDSARKMVAFSEAGGI